MQTEPSGAVATAADLVGGSTMDPGLRHRGVVLQLLDGIGSQETALSLIKRPVGSVRMLAYTLDRPDLVEAMAGARQRGLPVHVGCDRRFSLSGRCRDQEQSLRRLEAEGCYVRLLDGGPSTAKSGAGRAGAGSRTRSSWSSRRQRARWW